MARNLGDILRRFRPSVAPGPAAPAGVPADRVAEAEAELAVVLAALAPAIVEGRPRVAQARTDADDRRQAGIADAQSIVEVARAQSQAVRAEAAAARLAELDADRTRLEAEARGEVDRVGTAVAAHLPTLIDAVVAGVWATAGMEPGGAVSAERSA